MHDLRTRRTGGNTIVDVDVLVDPALTVSEGHRISEEVLKRLNSDIDEVIDVTVHVDPEDDEVDAPSGGAPMRNVMLERLKSHWQGIPGTEYIDDIALVIGQLILLTIIHHYLFSVLGKLGCFRQYRQSWLNRRSHGGVL